MADDFEITAEGGIDDLAPPEPEGGGEAAPEGEAAPAAAAPAATTTTPAAPAVDEPPWRKYLTPREGETGEQMAERLARERYEQSGRAIRAEREAADRLAGVEAELAAARKIYTEFLGMVEAGRKAKEPPPPDPADDPVGFLAAKVDGLGAKLTEREQAERTAAEEAEQEDRTAALREIDSWAANELLEGLGKIAGRQADPDFEAAFNRVEEVRWHELSMRYPDATDEQKAEAMTLARVIEGRHAATMGVSLRDVYKRRAAIYGLPGAANGNGKPAAGKAGATPTPAQVAAAAARAAKAGGVRRVAGGASTAAPATLADFAKLPEEEQAKLIAEGKVDESELWGGLAEEGWH